MKDFQNLSQKEREARELSQIEAKHKLVASVLQSPDSNFVMPSQYIVKPKEMTAMKPHVERIRKGLIS